MYYSTQVTCSSYCLRRQNQPSQEYEPVLVALFRRKLRVVWLLTLWLGPFLARFPKRTRNFEYTRAWFTLLKFQPSSIRQLYRLRTYSGVLVLVVRSLK